MGGAPVVEARELVPLTEEWPMLLWCPARVVGRGGAVADLQLLLALEPGGSGEGAICRLAASEGLAPVSVWDAVALDVARDALVARVLGGAGGAASVVEETTAATEVVVGDRRLRLHRPLVTGPRPDVAIPRALASTSAAAIAPAPTAVWRHGAHDLVSVWAEDPESESGDALAARSLDEVLDRRVPPSDAALDVGPPARELGAAVAQLHLGLAEAFGAAPLDARAVVDRLEEDLDATAPPGVDLDGVLDALGRLRDADDLGASIRVHDDLRLARLRRGGRGWQVVAFERDPFEPVAPDRRTTPLADLATLVRGIGGVAGEALRTRGVEPEDLDGREAALLAEAWEERAVAALVSGYASTEGIDALLPRSRDARDGLLSVVELVGALGEVADPARTGRTRALPRPAVTRLTPADHHRRW